MTSGKDLKLIYWFNSANSKYNANKCYSITNKFILYQKAYNHSYRAVLKGINASKQDVCGWLLSGAVRGAGLCHTIAPVGRLQASFHKAAQVTCIKPTTGVRKSVVRVAMGHSYLLCFWAYPPSDGLFHATESPSCNDPTPLRDVE